MPLTVAVENVLELRDRRRDLQAHVEDLLLALEADVCGPSDHAGDIALGLDVLADTEVPGTLLDKRVLCALETEEVRIADWDNVPWGPSFLQWPFPAGMARAPLSFPLVASCRRGCH
jgi:hypothetical protein